MAGRWSRSTGQFTRADFVADAAAFITELGLAPALVSEDTAVVTDESELAEVFVAMGMPALGYFLDSAVERDGQWQLCFDYADMLACSTATTWPDTPWRHDGAT